MLTMLSTGSLLEFYLIGAAMEGYPSLFMRRRASDPAGAKLLE
jgi:hypothetical protein